MEVLVILNFQSMNMGCLSFYLLFKFLSLIFLSFTRESLLPHCLIFIPKYLLLVLLQIRLLLYYYFQIIWIYCITMQLSFVFLILYFEILLYSIKSFCEVFRIFYTCYLQTAMARLLLYNLDTFYFFSLLNCSVKHFYNSGDSKCWG
jgi:hypothetical protein